MLESNHLNNLSNNLAHDHHLNPNLSTGNFEHHQDHHVTNSPSEHYGPHLTLWMEPFSPIVSTDPSALQSNNLLQNLSLDDDSAHKHNGFDGDTSSSLANSNNDSILSHLDPSLLDSFNHLAD